MKKSYIALFLMSISSLASADQFLIKAPINGMIGHSVESISFTTNVSSVNLGDKLSVSWSVTGNPDSVSISGIGEVAASGTQMLSLTKDTSLVLTATANGKSVSRTIDIKVIGFDVSSASLSLDNTTFNLGDPISVTWDATSISPDSVSIEGYGVVPSSGVISFTPGNVTSINLLITKSGITKTKSIPVNETNFTIGDITFTSDKTIITLSDQITLNWSITGSPSSVSITGVGTVSKSGTATITPGNISSIILTAKAGQKTVTKEIPLTVISKTSFLSCKDRHNYFPSEPSGIYTIDPDGEGVNAPFTVYCNNDYANGGWTLVYKNINYSTSNFYATPNMSALQSPTFDLNSNGSFYSKIASTETLVWNSDSLYIHLNKGIPGIFNDTTGGISKSKFFSFVAKQVGYSATSDSILVFRNLTSLSGIILGHGASTPWCSITHGRYTGGCIYGSYGKGNWLVYVR
jgi:Fibrinogen beta and gamma chains, C-terminal globular domain.